MWQGSLNMISRDGKTGSDGIDIYEIGTKWFPRARKSVSTNQNEEFIEK